MNNLTIVNLNSKLLVDSREVAVMVDKRHDHLLRDIDGYIDVLKQNPNLGNGLIVHIQDFFIRSEYESGIPLRRYKNYFLTRKGCDMVANKMTGEKGVLFTATYVTKFGEMEKALAQPKLPSTYLEALEALVESEKQKQILIPKAEYFDALVDRNLLTNFRDAAKEIKIKESAFIAWLIAKKYVYRDPSGKLKPYAQYVPKLFEIKEWERNSKAGNQTMITPRGRETFRLLLESEKVLA